MMGAYVAQHKRPVFESIGCASAGGHFQCPFKTRKQANTGGKHDFGVSNWFHHEAKMGAFWALRKNTPKLNTTVHICICICIYTHIYYTCVYVYVYVLHLFRNSVSLALLSLFLYLSQSLSIYIYISIFLYPSSLSLYLYLCLSTLWMCLCVLQPQKSKTVNISGRSLPNAVRASFQYTFRMHANRMWISIKSLLVTGTRSLHLDISLEIYFRGGIGVHTKWSCGICISLPCCK